MAETTWQLASMMHFLPLAAIYIYSNALRPQAATLSINTSLLSELAEITEGKNMSRLSMAKSSFLGLACSWAQANTWSLLQICPLVQEEHALSGS